MKNIVNLFKNISDIKLKNITTNDISVDAVGCVFFYNNKVCRLICNKNYIMAQIL